MSLVFSLAALGVLGGCSSDAGSCETAADCGSEATCQAGACVPLRPVGGTVSGLLAGSSVVLENAGEALTVSANGPFTFLQGVAEAGAFAVSVREQPVGQHCTVEGGSGMVPGEGGARVTVVCVKRAFTVRGTVTGLKDGQPLVLKNNGGDALTVTSDGPFSFPTQVAFGDAFAVTAEVPFPYVCDVTRGSGTLGAGDVTDVAVTCATRYTVGGTVSGLVAGTGVELRNGADDVLTVQAPGGSFTFAVPVADLGGYAVTVTAQPEGQTCAVEGGSGTVQGGDVTSVNVVCAPRTFALRGRVLGLLGSTQSVVLKNNGGDALTITASRSFTFPTPVRFGDTYAVTVDATYPVSCGVANGSGTMGTQDVTEVAITCSTAVFTVGGEITGMPANRTLRLRNNDGEELAFTGSGPFTFTLPVPDLGGYRVTVLSVPRGFDCTVANGTGTLSGANVTSVAVTCAKLKYVLGGNLTGLGDGQSVVVKNSGGDALTLSANGSFTFPTQVAFMDAYAVTVEATYPLVCSVPNGAGAMSFSDFLGVAVTCGTESFTVGGAVTGLVAGTTLELWNNGGDALTVTEDDSFTFTRPVADLGGYAVTVKTQPAGQTCTVHGGTGTLNGANVTGVAVACEKQTFVVGGSVTGLPAGQSLVLKNNGGDALTLTEDGPFSFPTRVAFDSGYAVTAEAGSPLVCSVTSGAGTMPAREVSDVAVRCGTTAYAVGGAVSGLAPGTPLELRNNGDEVLAVTADGPFTFTRPVVDLGGYAVTVKTQPAGQRCTVTVGTGTVSGSPISDVAVTCGAVHRVHVGVAGLTGTLVLRNGPEELTVSTDGDASFSRALLPGEPYTVAVKRHPLGQTCEVAGGSGTLGDADVTLAVSCAPNAMVLRVGGGAAELNASATLAVLEEYRPTGGVPVRILRIPTTGTGGADRLTLAGSQTSEGYLSRSGDGRFITFAGYDADVGTPNVISTLPEQTARCVGQVDVFGDFTVPTRVSDAYTTVRAAATLDGSSYWLSGAANSSGGIRHAPRSTSATPSVLLSGPISNTGALGLFDGRLFFALAIPPVPNPNGYTQGVLTFPSARPTEAGETPAQLFSVALTSAGFALLDVDPAVPGLDTAYVSINVDSGGVPTNLRLEKWTSNGTSWSKVAGFIPAFASPQANSGRWVASNAVSAVKTPTGVRVYVTSSLGSSGGAGNKLATFLDDGSTLTPVATVLATAPANTAFRGVAASPRP
ncbi:hypothetical protein [Pyxidicoccus trucidator]|uniref:hypothetical protein n=1 Tax=Pyxidicoccus trucidator TaxID=2709662 RepID=UPI0013DCA815|nr:hypothetical protein [Pyxidicoccus trucidator]